MEKLIKMALTQTFLGSLARRLPFLADLYARAVWSRRMNLFHGLHESFEAAEAHARRFSAVGWNDSALAKEVIDHEHPVHRGGMDPTQPSQFAVLLWLGKLLRRDMTVLDVGGAGGIAFETAKRFDLLDEGHHWHVVDMPRMVDYGRARHARLKSERISFGTDLALAPPSDLLLALGAIQYMRDPFGQYGPGLLESLGKKPDYILLNKVPVWDGPDLWTNQSFVTTSSPYRIFNRDRLMRYVEQHGYRIAHGWQVRELDLRIPFHPECSLDYFEGFLAVRTDLQADAARPRLAAAFA
ncbi:methyltransferase, TIGR04325 family [Xanthobacteraceae bacterium A53D]